MLKSNRPNLTSTAKISAVLAPKPPANTLAARMQAVLAKGK